MTQLIIVLRKMIKNRWLTSCLLFGLLIAIGLISGIPIYSNGIIQRLLVKEMEKYQTELGVYPGNCLISLNFSPKEQNVDKYNCYNQIDTFVKKRIPSELNIPYHILVEDLETDMFSLYPEDPSEANASIERMAKIKALSNLEEHIELTHGVLPSDQKVHGVYEVLVTRNGLEEMEMELNKIYIMKLVAGGKQISLRIKPVGVFKPKQEGSYFWVKPTPFYNKRIYINSELFVEDFIREDRTLLKSSEWYYSLDYRQINVERIEYLTKTYRYLNKDLVKLHKHAKIDIPIFDSLEPFTEMRQQMNILLFTLNTPVLLMLFFYIFAVSVFTVENDKNEIALYKSRGMGKGQIVFQYMVQAMVLGVIIIIIGPYFGLLSTKILGVPKGFMDFEDRIALRLSLNPKIYLASGLGILIFFVMLSFIAFKAADITIITQKQEMARDNKKQLWKKIYLDIIFLCISFYGIYNFKLNQEIMEVTGINIIDVKISPLLFMASTFFILGAGLLFIRIYPLILRFIWWAGKRIWPLSLYETLMRISRNFNRYQFISVFFIMTLATGLFSANIARTINVNTGDKIKYEIGGDMVLMPLWQFEKIDIAQTYIPESTDDLESQYVDIPVQYIEPPFDRVISLSQVMSGAKVFKKDKVMVQGIGFNTDKVQLMAIEPYHFGKTVWMRQDLLSPYHINEYLNIMTHHPSNVLISRTLMESYDVKLGDSISMGWKGSDMETFTVCGVVDYWPSWNPIIQRDEEGRKTRFKPMLVVANLAHVQENIGIEPYEIWLKLHPDTNSSEVYQEMKDKNIKIIEIKDARQMIKEESISASNAGINGATTLAFICSAMIVFSAILVYWGLEFKNRKLELGILRALGMPMHNIAGMVIWEQLFVSVASAITGIIIGGTVSNLFIPFFQLAYNVDSQIIPFRTISEQKDRISLYVFFIFMLFITTIALIIYITKLEVISAIKLGED